MKDSEKQLIQAARTVLRITRILQQECENRNFTMQQYRALSWIDRHHLTRPYALAEQAAVSRPAMVAIINSLEKKGLLKRETVSQDGRGVHIKPTAKTKKAIKSLELAMVGRLQEVFGDDIDTVSALADTPALEEALDAQLRQESSKRGGMKL